MQPYNSGFSSYNQYAQVGAGSGAGAGAGAVSKTVEDLIKFEKLSEGEIIAEIAALRKERMKSIQSQRVLTIPSLRTIDGFVIDVWELDPKDPKKPVKEIEITPKT